MPALARYGVRAAALAAAVAVLGAAPAAATDPSRTLWMDAPPGLLISVPAHGWYGEGIGEEGTNPEIVEATFSTTEYYDTHLLRNGRVWVQAKSAADLNALAAPPAKSFEVTVDISMNNDEDRAISGTIVFRTRYVRTSSAPLPSDTEETSGGDG